MEEKQKAAVPADKLIDDKRDDNMNKDKSHGEMAVEYFSQKLHCSQSVLLAFADECGITKDQAVKLGSCFGSGMRKGEVCGAVTGALMVLGLLYGQTDALDANGRQVSNKINDMMMNRFKEKCDSFVCNDLLKCDISTAEGIQFAKENNLFTEFCPLMVKAAVEVLEGIILERNTLTL